jgi:hypothetical protein
MINWIIYRSSFAELKSLIEKNLQIIIEIGLGKFRFGLFSNRDSDNLALVLIFTHFGIMASKIIKSQTQIESDVKKQLHNDLYD